MYAVYLDLNFVLPRRPTTTLVNRSCGMKGGPPHEMGKSYAKSHPNAPYWPTTALSPRVAKRPLLCPVEVYFNWTESGYIPACPAETYDSSGRYVVQFRRPCYSVRDWYGGLMERAVTRNYSRR